jgi:hypothetical protein
MISAGTFRDFSRGCKCLDSLNMVSSCAVTLVIFSLASKKMCHLNSGANCREISLASTTGNSLKDLEQHILISDTHF